MVRDETQLGVEAGVLRQMTAGVVRLSAEDGTDLEDPLEHADHGLLVELRRLGQVSGPAEVVDLEDVRAALGGRLDDLRREDLGEASRVQGRAEACGARGGDLEAGAQQRMPQRRRRVVQDRRQRGREGRPVQVERGRLRRAGQHNHDRLGELGAAWRLGVRYDQALDLQDRLLGCPRELRLLPGRRGPAAGRTTWASPARSRMTRNVTDLSSRRRCSQPAIATRSPMCLGSSADSTREIITAPSGDLRDPLGVRAIRELAVPPHFRHPGSAVTAGLAGSLVEPGDGG